MYLIDHHSGELFNFSSLWSIMFLIGHHSIESYLTVHYSGLHVPCFYVFMTVS